MIPESDRRRIAQGVGIHRRAEALGLAVGFLHGRNLPETGGVSPGKAIEVAEVFRKYIETGEQPS